MTDETMNLADARAYAVAGQRLRDEAAEDRKVAAGDREAARYDRGQAEHRHKEIADIERGIAERERRLVQLKEPELAAREKAAADKLVEAQNLLSQYHADRHAAARALVEINKREKAERSEAA